MESVDHLHHVDGRPRERRQQSRSWPHLQQELEIVNDVVGWSTEGRQPAEFSLPVDQVEGRRMIHCVSECLIPGNHLLGDDAVGFLNGRELTGGACGAEEARVEGGQVLAQALWTVALWIDRYVDQLDLARRAPQLLVDFGQVGKRDRADILTKGVAELQDDHLAEMVAQAQLITVGAVQAEGGRLARRLEGTGAKALFGSRGPPKGEVGSQRHEGKNQCAGEERFVHWAL